MRPCGGAAAQVRTQAIHERYVGVLKRLAEVAVFLKAHHVVRDRPVAPG